MSQLIVVVVFFVVLSEALLEKAITVSCRTFSFIMNTVLPSGWIHYGENKNSWLVELGAAWIMRTGQEERSCSTSQEGSALNGNEWECKCTSCTGTTIYAGVFGGVGAGRNAAETGTGECILDILDRPVVDVKPILTPLCLARLTAGIKHAKADCWH